MRRDQSILVEGVLRDFPAINRDMQDRKQWLEVMAVSPGGSGDRVDGGSFSPLQDRFMKAMDEKYYRRLQRIVSIVYSAYCELTDSERRVVSLSCFEDMDIGPISAEIDASYRYVQRLKASALSKMRRACMDVISDVDDWREREHAELTKSISLLYSS